MAREKILVVSAIVGLVAILIGRRRLLYVVPIVWCGVALLVFGFHRPLWHHHLLMALVPMAWLGGIAARVGLDWLATIRARTWMRYSYLLVICTMLVVAAVWAAPRFGTTTATVNPLDHAVAAALLGEVHDRLGAIKPKLVASGGRPACRASALPRGRA